MKKKNWFLEWKRKEHNKKVRADKKKLAKLEKYNIKNKYGL